MSIHPSLKSSLKHKKHRCVLKRSERLKTMMEKGDWKEGDDCFGLPKIKSVRIKIKKEKVEKVEAAAATTEGVAPATSSETKKEETSKEKK